MSQGIDDPEEWVRENYPDQCPRCGNNRKFSLKGGLCTHCYRIERLETEIERIKDRLDMP